MRPDYRWRDVPTNAMRAQVLTYKGVRVGAIEQREPRKFIAYKLDEKIGEYSTALKAQLIVETPWVEMEQ